MAISERMTSITANIYSRYPFLVLDLVFSQTYSPDIWDKNLWLVNIIKWRNFKRDTHN